MAELSCLAAACRLRQTTRSIGCLITSARRSASYSTTSTPISSRPSVGPKPHIDVRHIRENPELYERTCIDRNYTSLAKNPRHIIQLFESWKSLQYKAKGLRERNNALLRQMKGSRTFSEQEKHKILDEAKELKEQIAAIEQEEHGLDTRIQELAIELPNLTDQRSPVGAEPKVIKYINEHPDHSDQPLKTKSHVEIGAELDLFDFTAAGTTSGWGFYFLKNEAALLEQALIQYALKEARSHGFQIVSPPSMVYSHISTACGFRPRDSGGEQQVYTVAQAEEDKAKPELSLAGTAEIPFAAMKASTDMSDSDLPLRLVGSSRCYRAEAGSRGIDTKGLYRVHEFTKVEMFAWTLPGDELLEQMLQIQMRIMEKLGLHCRVLEQPTYDLGASASRKRDIEAFFPSRRNRSHGWGELTSTSNCTDYQTRRLATRTKDASGKFKYPHTVNGTALAVPRVLAAILENNWDESTRAVHIPEVLHPWMCGIHVIDRLGSSK